LYLVFENQDLEAVEFEGLLTEKMQSLPVYLGSVGTIVGSAFNIFN
jgi:hypothetical protein